MTDQPDTTTTGETRPAPRRRGIYTIGVEQLARAVRLPAGQHFVSATARWETSAVLLMAEGDGLPEVADGCDPPQVNMSQLFYCPLPASALNLPAPQLHAAVLLTLDIVHLEDAAALEGRRRIIERHAPVERSKFPDEPHFCGACIDRPDFRGASAGDWPCEDYRDAARGILHEDPNAGAYLPAGAEDLDSGHPYAQPGGAELASADRALLSDPATGAALDAAVLGTDGSGPAGPPRNPAPAGPGGGGWPGGAGGRGWCGSGGDQGGRVNVHHEQGAGQANLQGLASAALPDVHRGPGGDPASLAAVRVVESHRAGGGGGHVRLPVSVRGGPCPTTSRYPTALKGRKLAGGCHPNGTPMPPRKGTA